MALKGTTNEEKIWNFLTEKGLPAYGCAGLMGNLYAESGLLPTNLQNGYEKKLGYTDASYTAAVDSEKYQNFVKDCAGYGLAQWTYWSRKQNLLNFAKAEKKSIGDLEMQLNFLWKEMLTYKGLIDMLKNAKTVREASDVILVNYERPANQSEAVKTKRAGYGQTYYTKYAGKTSGGSGNAEKGNETMSKCYASTVLKIAAGEIGYHEKASNSQLDNKTANAGSKNWTKYARDFDEKYPKWYNGKKNGYEWCDMFVDWCFLTAFGYSKALELLCQPERSCGAGCTYSLMYYRNREQFHTSDPKPGDQIFFGTALNDAEHTGLVERVDSTKVYTIEGNTSNQVARRSYALGSSKILGYGRPKYDAESGTATTPTAPVTPSKPTTGGTANIKVGDVVNFKGSKHYTSSTGNVGYSCKAGKAKVTAVSNGAKHPYHLVNMGNGCTVYGWVNAADVEKNEPETIHTVKSGDTLWDLSVKYLGNGARYREIMKLNGLTSTTIRVGQQLKIPKK